MTAGVVLGLASVVFAVLGAGMKAPDFTLPTLDGKTYTLSEAFTKPGKVVVLDLWATWCPPCRAEIPFLVRLHKDYSGKGAIVVGVAIDPEKDRGKVEDFARQHKINYTVPLDPGGQKTAAAYKVRGIPATFIIDRKGVIRYAHVGFSGEEDAAKIESEVKKLLAEKQ